MYLTASVVNYIFNLVLSSKTKTDCVFVNVKFMRSVDTGLVTARTCFYPQYSYNRAGHTGDCFGPFSIVKVFIV